MSKYTFRIPTHQFAYVEVEHEPEEELTPKQISGFYDELFRAFRFSTGIPKEEWNDCLDQYMMGRGMSASCGERMNQWQRDVIADLDRSEARRKPKTQKTYTENKNK